jgi:hypothetical protein
VGLVTCIRCNHEILPGQIHLAEDHVCRYRGQIVATHFGPAHVACPTEREVQIARRWGRWA